MTQRVAPPGAGQAPARYELTVAGRIGPVLRCALRAHGGGTAHTCVVVRAVSPADLIDLMQVLDGHGLDIRNVSRLPTTAQGA